MLFETKISCCRRGSAFNLSYEQILTIDAIKLVRVTKERRKALISKRINENPEGTVSQTLGLTMTVPGATTIKLPKLRSEKCLNGKSSTLKKTHSFFDKQDRKKAQNSSIGELKLRPKDRSKAIHLMSSTASNVRHMDDAEKYNFFATIKKDNSKIKRFINESQIFEETNGRDHIQSVLDKSKFWEDRLQHYAIKENMREQLMAKKNIKSLNLITEKFKEHTEREYQILSRKHKDFISELNKVNARVQAQQKNIKQMNSTLNNMRIPSKAEEVELENEQASLLEKLHAMKKQAKTYKNFKDRMVRILDIAEINQYKNEEWIRNLNFYTSNLDKAIKIQQKEIEKLQEQNRVMDEDIDQLRDKYNVIKYEHLSLISEIEAEQERKEYINQTVAKTDLLIQRSVDLRKNEVEEEMLNELEQEKFEKEKVELDKKNKKIREDLTEMKELYQKYSKLFESDSDGQPWDTKLRLKQTLNEIETKKDLERQKLEFQLRLDYERESLEYLQQKLGTLKKANVNENTDWTEVHMLKTKGGFLQKTIENEKKMIEKYNEYLDSTTIINNDTNLAVSSIARMLGIASVDNDIEVLQDYSLCEKVTD